MASRILHLCVLAAGLALVGTAVDLNLPWLLAENRRIEPWKVPLVWSSEATAFAIFVRACLARIVFATDRPPQVSRATLRSLFVAFALDAGYTAYETVAERLAYSSALPATAQVVSGRSFQQPIGHRRYSFTCEFRDRDGLMRRPWFTLLDEAVSPPVRKGVDRGRFPVPLAVLYDPNWPDRSWPAEVPYSDDNRLFVFSAIALLFSGLLAAFLALPGRWLGSSLPPEVAPFFGAVLLLNACGWTQGW